jgi:hypothetical protein
MFVNQCSLYLNEHVACSIYSALITEIFHMQCNVNEVSSVCIRENFFYVFWYFLFLIYKCTRHFPYYGS